MNVLLRGISAESLPGRVRSRTSYRSSPERGASIDPSTYTLVQSTHTDGMGTPVQSVLPGTERTETHKAQTSPRSLDGAGARDVLTETCMSFVLNYDGENQKEKGCLLFSFPSPPISRSLLLQNFTLRIVNSCSMFIYYY